MGVGVRAVSRESPPFHVGLNGLDKGLGSHMFEISHPGCHFMLWIWSVKCYMTQHGSAGI